MKITTREKRFLIVGGVHPAKVFFHQIGNVHRPVGAHSATARTVSLSKQVPRRAGEGGSLSVASMALPTRDEMLSHVELRFRELTPDAPVRLDPNDPTHAAMIRQWHQAHREVLSKLTNEAFFGYYPQAPSWLDPANPEHATFIEYWKDIAEQIDGRPGRPLGKAGQVTTARITRDTMASFLQ